MQRVRYGHFTNLKEEGRTTVVFYTIVKGPEICTLSC